MKRLLGIMGTTAFAACATPVPVTTSPAPSGGEASVSAPRSAGAQWSGNFIPANDRSAEVGMRGAVRSYGTVSVVPSGEFSRVSLTFGGYRAATLGWALAPGRCGSTSVPVLPSNAFPLIDVGSGGNAQMTGDIKYVLPTDGTFHVRIYKADGVISNSAQGPEGIVACSNLKYQQ